MRTPFYIRLIWTLAVIGGFLIFLAAGEVEIGLATLGIVLLCFACELMDSSLGMGYGTTLTPVLLLFGYDPLELVPTILISEFLSGFAASFFHAEAGNVDFSRRGPHLRPAAALALCSVAGVLAGVHLALSVDKAVLTILIGCVVLGAGLFLLASVRRTFTYRLWKVLLLGIVASFNKAVSGGGYGPLLTGGQIVSGVAGRAAVAITSFAEGFTCLVAALAFLLAGSSLNMGLLVPVVTGALLSVPISANIVRRLDERLIRAAVAGLTIIMGLVTLGRALL